MKKFIASLCIFTISSTLVNAGEIIYTNGSATTSTDSSLYKKEYYLSGTGEKGTLKFIGSLLGKDFNEYNTLEIKYNSAKYISGFKTKNGYEYNINYNPDGSFEIKVQGNNENKTLVYNNKNQKISEQANTQTYNVVPTQGLSNNAKIKTQAISGNTKGTLNYLKKLLGSNDWLYNNSNQYTIKYDEKGRVSVLNYNGTTQKPHIIRYNVIYNDNTTVVIGTGSSKQYDFARTFRDNGKEIK